MRALSFLLAFLICTLPAVAATLAQPAPYSASKARANASSSDFNLPKLGLAGGGALPLWKAQFLGRAIYRELQGAEVVINDPLVAGYVNYLGHQLSSAADAPDEPFHYFAIKAPVINAFALPGAYISIFSRLFLITRNEDELAGVMAHETAHIVQRHTARRMDDATYNNLINLGILLAGIIVAASGAGMGAVIAAQGGIMQRQINYTRADEFEADRVGIGILARAGFDPQGMIGFFQYMQRRYAMQGYNMPEFLSSHPLDLTRVTEAQMRAKSMRVTPQPENPNYALMRARLRVLISKDMNQTLEYFRAHKSTLDNPWYRDATVYGMVLCLNRLGQGDRALKLIKPLAQSHPNNVALQLALAQTLLAAGKKKAGLEALTAYNTLFPSNPAVIMAYAQALAHSGKAKQVVALLSPGLQDGRYRYNPEFPHLLANAADKIGRSGLAYYAMAHYFLERGQYRASSIQLRFGLKLKQVPELLHQRMEDMKKQVKEDYDRAVDLGIIHPKPGQPGPS